MWNSISFVTTGYALVAFALAVMLVLYKRVLKHREILIKSALGNDTLAIAKLVQYGYDPDKLSRKDQLLLAKREIQFRTTKLAKVTKIVLISLFLLFFVTICTLLANTYLSSLSASKASDPRSVPSMGSILETPHTKAPKVNIEILDKPEDGASVPANQ